MTERKDDDQDRPLADRRAEAGAPQEDDPDLAGEHEPGPTDPPNAEAEPLGGEEEGFTPHTEIP